MEWEFRLVRLLVQLLLFAPIARPCYLSGSDTGVCDNKISEIAEYKMAEMPFCASAIKYTPCVPEQKPVPPDRNFNRDGRWVNHTTLTKDRWVETRVLEMISYRVGLERNETLLNRGEDEYGIKGGIEPRFFRNPDCRNAYKNYFCWINFPRCDAYGQSLMTCRSACENFFRVCGYEKDLWRCGPSKYFNGYEPEGGGRPTRDYFPGQPFRDFDPFRTTCTPHLEGAATRALAPAARLACAVAAAVAGALWWL